MNIQTEYQLVELLAKNLVSEFNTDIAIKEFSAGYGIADLVFARNFFSSQNKVDREPINNYFALKGILSLPDNQSFSRIDLMQATGISDSMSLRILKMLLEKNYVKKSQKRQYIKTVKLINPVRKLVAIEVKLKDWKQGILQARRYKSFTDECYLAILSAFEKNIDYSYLERFGVGLILFDQNNGEILVKKRPAEIQYLSIYNNLQDIYAREEFLYRIRSNTSPEFLSM